MFRDGEAPNFHDFECPECAVRRGSIRMAAIVDNPERQQAFMDIMRKIVSDILEEVVGVRPAWLNLPYPALELERAGNS